MADEMLDTMQGTTTEDTQAEGVMSPSEGRVPTNMFEVLKNTDLLGMVVEKKGAAHSNDDYVSLFKLAGLNKEWRQTIQANKDVRLSANADRFMLDIGILYARGELAALVRGLLHFKYMNYEMVHLYAITALHVALSTGHFMAESRALKTTADAGGLEAVLSALFMNWHSSNVALSIVCVRMLQLYARYNKPTTSKWGVWTDKQSSMGMECITGAMRMFPQNLDLQCCAISCILTLCVQDGIPQDNHMTFCQEKLPRQGVLHLLMIAMHTHDNAAMHVDVCKLLFLHKYNVINLQSAPGVSCEVVALKALRHRVTLGDNESICFITKLLCQLCKEQSVHMDLMRNPAAIPLCIHILQEVRANIETETPEQAVQKQTTNVRTTTLLN